MRKKSWQSKHTFSSASITTYVRELFLLDNKTFSYVAYVIKFIFAVNSRHRTQKSKEMTNGHYDTIIRSYMSRYSVSEIGRALKIPRTTTSTIVMKYLHENKTVKFKTSGRNCALSERYIELYFQARCWHITVHGWDS